MLAFIGWLVLLIFLIVLGLVLLAAAVLSFVLPSLILRASCSVADLKEPRYLISFPLGYAIVAGYALLCWLFVALLGRFDQDPDAAFGSMHLCGYVVSFVLRLGRGVPALSRRPGPLVRERVLGGRAATVAPRPGRGPDGGAGTDHTLRLAAPPVPDTRFQLRRGRPPRPGSPPSSGRHDPRRRRHYGFRRGPSQRRPDGPAPPRRSLRGAKAFRAAAVPHGPDLANLLAHGEGVLHVTDDVLLLAKAVLGKLDPLPPLTPAVHVGGWVLADACRWYEFRITAQRRPIGSAGGSTPRWSMSDAAVTFSASTGPCTPSSRPPSWPRAWPSCRGPKSRPTSAS